MSPDDERFIEIGGRVDETSATLRIIGADLDPDEITRLLQFPASESWRKGDSRVIKRTGKVVYRKDGRWMLKSPRGKGDLDQHVEWLLTMVAPDLTVWASLKSRYVMDVYCGLFLGAFNRETGLSPKSMMELGKRGIMLSLDIYSHTEEDEDVRPPF